jgi:hypothetical protein
VNSVHGNREEEKEEGKERGARLLNFNQFCCCPSATLKFFSVKGNCTVLGLG